MPQFTSPDHHSLLVSIPFAFYPNLYKNLLLIIFFSSYIEFYEPYKTLLNLLEPTKAFSLNGLIYYKYVIDLAYLFPVKTLLHSAFR